MNIQINVSHSIIEQCKHVDQGLYANIFFI